ncbi:MAG: protein-disulfide reductase DsbD family protein [Bdellovibrionota bacterium]
MLRLVVLVGLLSLSAAAFSAPKKQDLLKYQVPKAVNAPKGKQTTVKLKFTVEKGFHVQANPASEKYLIATELKLEPNKDFKVATIAYPPCKEGKAMGPCKPFKIAGSEKAINAYEGTFEIAVPLTPAESLKAGAHNLTGTLKYQACNEQTCFFPTKLSVSFPVQVK